MAYEFKEKLQNPHFNNVMDVSPQEVFENKDKLTLVDVREPNEWTEELGHVDSSMFVVLHTVPEKLNTIPTDKPVVFVCRSGGRSAKACSFAKQNGLTNAFNMQGGMILWNRLQLPTKKTT